MSQRINDIRQMIVCNTVAMLVAKCLAQHSSGTFQGRIFCLFPTAIKTSCLRFVNVSVSGCDRGSPGRPHRPPNKLTRAGGGHLIFTGMLQKQPKGLTEITAKITQIMFRKALLSLPKKTCFYALCTQFRVHQ